MNCQIFRDNVSKMKKNIANRKATTVGVLLFVVVSSILPNITADSSNNDSFDIDPVLPGGE